MEYLTVEREAASYYEERRSKFIGCIIPIKDEAEAAQALERICRKHYDARHNCWAYSLYDGTERCSDDGEPQGTAGMPILEVMRGRKLTNCMIVVTRYFGGILLGPGGLARAYAKAAKDTADAAEAVRMVLCRLYDVLMEYSLYSKVQGFVYSFGGRINSTDFTQEVRLTAAVPEEKGEDFVNRITDITNGRASVCEKGLYWQSEK